MPHDLFRGEWMPLYWHRLLKDIRDLTTEQVGAYILLLGYQWEEGGIPVDVGRQAAIANISVPKMRAAMRAFGHRFTPHPTLPDTLANPFMERVREEQRLKFEKASRAGKIGAAARHGAATASSNRNGNRSANATSDGTTEASGDGTANATTDIENRDHHLASLGDAAGAHTREAAKKSPAYEFCRWMLHEGLDRGAIAGHHGEDEFKFAYSFLEPAETLLSHYGDAEARVRAERLFAMKLSRRLRRDVNPRTLLDAWDWDEIKGTFTVGGRTRFEADTEGL